MLQHVDFVFVPGVAREHFPLAVFEKWLEINEPVSRDTVNSLLAEWIPGGETRAEVCIPRRIPSQLERRSLAGRQAALKAKMLGAPQTYGAAGTEEIPLSANEAAPYWGQSPKATREHFRDLPGVRVIPSPPSYVGGRRKRAYETVLIPPSVLLREIDKSTKKSTKRGG